MWFQLKIIEKVVLKDAVFDFSIVFLQPYRATLHWYTPYHRYGLYFWQVGITLRGFKMTKILIIGMLFSTGCYSRSSAITPTPLGASRSGDKAQKQTLEEDCGWVVVNETETTKFLGITLDSYVRQYDESLFYCCPGEGDLPSCRQAEWHDSRRASRPVNSPESRSDNSTKSTPSVQQSSSIVGGDEVPF
jgi:hypothetical protein